jgi:hypothetical protein
MRCDHCPVAADLRCREFPGECRRAGQPGEGAFRAKLVMYAEAQARAMPSLARQAVNFIGAVASHVAAGMPTAPPEQQEQRLAICQACENYRDGTCLVCGCNLRIKTGWTDQGCPIGKWGPITSPSAP